MKISDSVVSLFSSKPLQIALLVGGLIYFFYRSGKKAQEEKQLYNNDLPAGGNGIPATGSDSTGRPIYWDASAIANELYDVLNGWLTLAATKEKVLVKMSALTDDQLVAMYNTFNKLFYDKGKGTMIDWIEDEYNMPWLTIRSTIVARLRGLNLR